MDSKHKAVWDWLYSCPQFPRLYFVFSKSENGDTVIAPVSAVKDSVQKRYIDGGEIKNYDFAIIQYGEYTTQENTTENIDVLATFERLAAWVEEQDRNKRFPLFPKNCDIQSIKVLPSDTGGIAGVDEKGVKYMFMCQINYYENE